MKCNQLLVLPEKDSGIDNLICRIHSKNLGQFGRRTPVIIENSENNAQCIRYVMGGGGFKGLTKDSVAIDYDGLLTLGYKLKDEQSCSLNIRKAKWYEHYLFFAKHPDLAVRLSMQLGLTGVFLGMIGLFLGVVSLI